ncbi:MAG: DNA double-strand break repair nuclease NurA [Bacillota bacterium]|nr:DNA double-strand break repair nuclease NurA [Bacillota bacterium]
MEKGRRAFIFPQVDGLVSELKELNNYLKKRKQVQGSYEARRREARQKGLFFPLRRLGRDEIEDFFRGFPLVGVDGSLNTVGASFPYTVTFFRALARSSRVGAGGEQIWVYQIFSPLLPEHRAKVEEKLKLRLDPEEAVARLRWETLAALEAEVGKRALEKEHPRLLLWDGGFARLETHAPSIWNDVKSRALGEGVVMLGITEEIATSVLGGALPVPGEYGVGELAADREILYGLLRPGEGFQRKKEDREKVGRVYVRLARHPQVIAVDYFPEQSEDLLPALNFLYTITPEHGRGFPFWLDLVDAEVRITREQVEVLLANYLDPALAEVYFRPLRARRDL